MICVETCCAQAAGGKGFILCLCGAIPAPLLCGNLPCHCPSNRAEHLLIHRIQSHTNPKRRKGFLKQAGPKSSKEELPKQRKAPKRAVECRLKVQTHIWDCIPRHSNPTRRTKHCQTERKSIKHQQKASVFLYPFSPFFAIPNTEIFQTRKYSKHALYIETSSMTSCPHSVLPERDRTCLSYPVFEPKYICIFSTKSKKIHTAIPLV